MEPLLIVGAVIGNQLSQKLEGWSKPSFQTLPIGNSEETRKENINSGKNITLSSKEIKIVERYLAASHGERNNYEKLTLDVKQEYPSYGSLDFREFAKSNQIGPHTTHKNNLICFGSPTDEKTGFRSYRFKCPYCKEKSVHINNVEEMKIKPRIFGRLGERYPILSNELLVSDIIDEIMENVTEVIFSQESGGQYEDKGYICSSCGNMNWVEFGPGDCNDGFEIGPDYRKIVPRAASENSATTTYCMLCGADHSLTGQMGALFR